MSSVFRPKKILVPVDDSPGSTLAWEQAKTLARLFGAKLEALHVRRLDQVIGLAAGGSIWVAPGDDPASKAIRKRVRGYPLSEICGEPAGSIARGAKERGFDLIVMGTHGRGALARTFIGSVAESVARRSSVPVLIARGGLRRRFASVLAPVNFTPHSYRAVPVAAQAAFALGADLRLLAVAHPPQGAVDMNWTLRRLQDICDRLPKKVRGHCRPAGSVLFGVPAEQIVKTASEHSLIVLTSHRRGLLKDALGTTAERVLRDSPVPVLCVPDAPAAGEPAGLKASGGERGRLKEVVA